jgi:hypothetical protein
MPYRIPSQPKENKGMENVMSQQVFYLKVRCHMGFIAKPERILINNVQIDLTRIVDWYRESAESRGMYITDKMVSAGYSLVGSGKDRITFLAPHKRFVLKFPRHDWGLYANERESRNWATRFRREAWANHQVQFAPCHMVGNVILMMRTVWDLCGNTVGCDKGSELVGRGMNEDGQPLIDVPIPDWIGCIDACQVGRLANGKWVAYDYADD